MNDASKLEQFMSGRAAGGKLFGDPAKASDALLAKPHSPHCSATETWWYQFFIPELQLNGEIYFWVHTNLRTMSGGVWIFQGIKKFHLQAEHFNWKNHMPYPEVTAQGLFAPEIGLRIDIVEPLKKQIVTYDDARTDTHLRLEANAVREPICRANDMHYEQPMHLTGTLRLNGRDLRIDCVANRDRSWGEPRYEDAMAHPSTAWCIGYSPDGGTGFLFNGCDDPAWSPAVAAWNLPRENLIKDGWFLRDGDLRRVVSLSKRTTRGEDGMQPLHIDCDFVDSAGDTHHVAGDVIASILFCPWPNMAAYFGALCRWTLDGNTLCYGDSQEVFWTDAVKQMLR